MLIASSFFPFTKNENEYINSYKAAKEKGKSYFISIPLILFFILLSFIYSYARVTGKLLMQIHFISPYTLIFYVGILGFIFTICASLISHIDYSYDNNKNDINANDIYIDNIFDYASKLKDLYNKNKFNFFFEIFFVNIIYSFIMFMEIVFELLTVYYLNPLFILITNNLCYGVIQLITFIVEYNNDGLLVICLFLCEEFAEIFALMGYSVYLEIIELHFCELDQNLKRKIIDRGDIELRETINFKENFVEEENDDSDEEENESKEDKENNNFNVIN